MTGPTDPGPAVARAGELAAAGARAEAARLADGLGLALSALSSIEDRARDLAGDSARVRALGFELLPRSYYIEHRVTALRVQLGPVRSLRRSARRIRDRVDEIAALLDRVVEFTATVDVAGELDLPLELVSVAQTGARSGLACLDRLRAALDLVGTGTRASVPGPRPSRPAELLVNTAGRLLPAGSRDRYAEEFRSELYELADTRASSRAQIAHALGLFARLWSLRRALPSGPGPAGRGRAEVPVARRISLRTSWFHAVRQEMEARVDRWEARGVLRAQARAQREELAQADEGIRPPGHTRDRTRISVRHRRRRR